MALMPKRVKHRKSQRGRIKGNATRGNRVVFGDYGLQSTQAGWIKAQTIEAGRIAAGQRQGGIRSGIGMRECRADPARCTGDEDGIHCVAPPEADGRA